MIGRAEIVTRARQHVGHREVTSNRSPLIDGWIQRCGLDPRGAFAWCAAFASWCLLPTPGCAGAVRLGQMFPATRNPQPGDLMWFRTDAKGAGHIGIVISGNAAHVLCIEGNSDNRVRYVLRLRDEVQFSRTREEDVLLPALPDDICAPIVRVSKAGTR